MQHLEVSAAVRRIYMSLGCKRLILCDHKIPVVCPVLTLVVWRVSGRRQLIQFPWTCQSVFRSPLCDASREIRGAFPQTSVFSSAQLNTPSTRSTRASCGNTIFTTLPSIESAHHLRHNWSMEGHHQGHTVS